MTVYNYKCVYTCCDMLTQCLFRSWNLKLLFFTQHTHTQTCMPAHTTQTVGAALSGAGTYYTIRNNAEEQIYDRSYRLRYNRGQCYMDQVTYGGVLGGLVLGAALVPASRLMGGLYGASMGFGLAVPTQVATSSHFVAKDKEEKK